MDERSGINRTVIILGLVSLFTDISSEMVVPLIPLFLSGVLLVDTSIIGLVEGIAEGTANILKGVSGFITDRIDRKRKMLFLGYGLSSISKPVMALANHWGIILGARFGDRVGKGIRTSPRDYLLSSSVNESFQGLAFGFHRAMDTTGAIIGSFLALVILLIFSTSTEVYRIAFLISFVPALIGLFFILLLKEKKRKIQIKSQIEKKLVVRTKLSRKFWVFIGLVISFGFVQVSPAFLILRSQEIYQQFNPIWWPFHGEPLADALYAIFAFLIFNIVYALTATKLGSISDKIGRIPVLIAGLVVFSIVLFLFSMIPMFGMPELVILAMAIYGLYIASTEGILKAFVADLTKGELILIRGTAYGWFNLSIGLTALITAILFGLMWKMIGSSNTFLLFAFLIIIPIIGFYRFNHNN